MISGSILERRVRDLTVELVGVGGGHAPVVDVVYNEERPTDGRDDPWDYGAAEVVG